MKIVCRYCNLVLPQNRELDLCGRCSYPRSNGTKETALSHLTDDQPIILQPDITTAKSKSAKAGNR